MAYTNSSLVDYTNISPSKNSPRNQKIDTITIHCMAGQMTAKNCCDMFAKKENRVSSNYCVGSDAKIALSCPESDRSWCSSSGANDHRAITIEVACNPSHPYAVKDAVYNKMLDLVTDICKRNGITKLVWSTNKTDRVNHKNGCNMTVHRDYANKACPGQFLYERMGQIASTVNARLGNSNTTTTTTTQKPTTTTKEIYRIRLSWQDSKTQIGAYSNLESAKKSCLAGYTVYDSNGNAVYNVPVNYTYYVRKTFADKKSQLGAYTVLKNAVFFCDKYYGYSVFDQTGKEVHKSGAKLGDINGDDKVDIADARELMRYVTALQKLDDAQKSRADINQDGKIDINDARDLMNKAIKK